jgi:hypothetical protein
MKRLVLGLASSAVHLLACANIVFDGFSAADGSAGEIRSSPQEDAGPGPTDADVPEAARDAAPLPIPDSGPNDASPDADGGKKAICTDGIAGDGVCCASSCGECGGVGCSGRPGGAEACCANTIRAAGVMCSGANAPCVLAP